MLFQSVLFMFRFSVVSCKRIVCLFMLNKRYMYLSFFTENLTAMIGGVYDASVVVELTMNI